MSSIKQTARRLLPPSVRWKLNNFLTRCGYGSVVDCTQFNIPMDAIEKHSPKNNSEKFRSTNVLVNIPIENCISLGSAAFRCTYEARNPFVCTSIEVANNLTQKYSDSTLKKFYTAFIPVNAAEYLDLPVDSAKGILRGSPLSAALPWALIPPGAAQEKLNASVVKFENKRNGGDVGADKGDKYFGPVASEKGEIEFFRLMQVVQSIKEKGYKRSNNFDGDIIGQLMVHDDRFIVFIRSGNHRIAALSALGYETIPIRIHANNQSIINRSRAGNWFNVRNNTFSLSEALEVFDRIFEGRQPVACKIDW